MSTLKIACEKIAVKFPVWEKHSWFHLKSVGCPPDQLENLLIWLQCSPSAVPPAVLKMPSYPRAYTGDCSEIERERDRARVKRLYLHGNILSKAWSKHRTEHAHKIDTHVCVLRTLHFLHLFQCSMLQHFTTHSVQWYYTISIIQSMKSISTFRGIVIYSSVMYL